MLCPCALTHVKAPSLFPSFLLLFHRPALGPAATQITPYRAGHVLGAAMFLVEVAGCRCLYTGDYSRLPDRHLPAADIPPVKPHIGEGRQSGRRGNGRARLRRQRRRRRSGRAGQGRGAQARPGRTMNIDWGSTGASLLWRCSTCKSMTPALPLLRGASQ